MKILVTGNIGCGKSTVVGMLKQLLPNYTVFDFDRMVHSLYESPSLQAALYQMFNTSDRAKVSDIVHKDQEQMKKLRSVIDPQIVSHLLPALNEQDIILDIPLWFEQCDKHFGMLLRHDTMKICVLANEADQMERVKARNGFSEEKIRSIIAQQLPQDEKAAKCDTIINNIGTVDDLQNIVNCLIPSLNKSKS